jgi:hypothetical protein
VNGNVNGLLPSGASRGASEAEGVIVVWNDQGPPIEAALEKRLASPGHGAPVDAEILEYEFAFAIAQRGAAAKARQRMLVSAERDFDSHYFVFRLAGRTTKLGHVLLGAILDAMTEL